MTNPIPYLFKKLWHFSKGNRHMIVLYVGLFACANVINLIRPLIIGWVLNTLQESGITSDNVVMICWMLSFILIITVVFWCFHGPARVIEMQNAYFARAKYKQYLFAGTLGLPLAWHTDHHSGDTIDKVEKASQALRDFGNTTFEIIETIVRIVFAYTTLVIFNVHSSYIVLIMVVLTVWIILRMDKGLIVQHKKLLKFDNVISAKVYDALSNVTSVVILRVEKLVSSSLWKTMVKPFSAHRKYRAISETKWFLVSVSTATMMVLVLVSYVVGHINVGIQVGTIFILHRYVENINNLFFRFAYRYGDLVRQKTAMENVETIAVEFSESNSEKQYSMQEWKTLSIHNLSFSYDDKQDHLDNVSLEIGRRQKVAVIGESGSGKTTLLKVIRELYAVQAAEVRLDGKKLPKGFGSISSHISLLPQDPELFNATIKENITLGVTTNMKQIQKHSDLAHFTKVAEALPKQFESNIQERGVNLSGGQKQRLALARGLLFSESKQIILLDEPTSSVDSENELAIYHDIFEYYKNKTIISSLHRLHLLQLFDYIYYFDNGKIIAQGTLADMLKNRRFKRLWNAYMQEYKK